MTRMVISGGMMASCGTTELKAKASEGALKYLLDIKNDYNGHSEGGMAVWGVAEAKARMSEMLDKTEMEGPQVVRRRKTEFHLLTKEQLAERCKAPSEEMPFVSAWEALRPSFAERYDDVDFPRLEGDLRDVDLG